MVVPPRFKHDPIEILQFVGVGDSIAVIVPRQESLSLPQKGNGSNKIRLDIKVHEMWTAEEFNNVVLPSIENKGADEEQNLIEKYVEEQGWKVTVLPSGLRIVIDEKGEGPPVAGGARLTMNYTGKLLSGIIFDSNQLSEFDHVEPFEFIVGSGTVISGWDEGVRHFNEGGKGKLIIPSKLAYGEQSIGKIPAKSPLIFEIEILHVKP